MDSSLKISLRSETIQSTPFMEIIYENVTYGQKLLTMDNIGKKNTKMLNFIKNHIKTCEKEFP